jgi:hypothetical protein
MLDFFQGSNSVPANQDNEKVSMSMSKLNLNDQLPSFNV